ncbi:MAG TPA: hypothetical protein PLS62_14460 [Desulfobacteraceae bacterium]|nr:hypothetical protein [Desulfobacteraceae bacterium]
MTEKPLSFIPPEADSSAIDTANKSAIDTANKSQPLARSILFKIPGCLPA